ncbi:MAG TPA: methyltransferase [Alphaproteobacteria bacterium]|nr:methyltransferase [Alphaproteobacteria bacterium]
MSEPTRSDAYRRIYAVVRRIPRGRVSTYGDVADRAGLPGHARQVGYALHALRDDDGSVPWQRVVNARGAISPRSEPGVDGLQRRMLEAEGVVFDTRGCIDLERFGWRPRQRGAQWASAEVGLLPSDAARDAAVRKPRGRGGSTGR